VAVEGGQGAGLELPSARAMGLQRGWAQIRV
jgi:hypothetical protein